MMSRGIYSIAKNIKKHREKLAITQDQLAISSGVAYNVIIKIESGATANPTVETALKIAKGLKITVDDLLQSDFNQGVLRCNDCKKEYLSSKKIWRCECGGLLNLIFNASFPIEEIKKRKQTMWRYREAIPIENDKHIVTFDEAITPLSKMSIGDREIFVKLDQLFTSGSYKDRGAAILISKVREFGITNVVEDSFIDDMSGSASNAITSYCAHSNILCDLYAPVLTKPHKLIQAKFFGAKVHTLPNSKKEASEKMLHALENAYYVNHSWNPFFFHGTKIFAFEVWEQLGWHAPDTIIVPVGNGTLLLGIYIGFFELLNAGMITKIPKIVGVQSVSCAPLYIAYKKHVSHTLKIKRKATLTEGLSVEEPIRGKEIIEVIKNTNGEIIVVNEGEIKKALREMFGKGFTIGLTSAVTIAGVKKYIPKSKENEIIVSAFTGNGQQETGKILELLKN